jgi:hypothetical protein
MPLGKRANELKLAIWLHLPKLDITHIILRFIILWLLTIRPTGDKLIKKWMKREG